MRNAFCFILTYLHSEYTSVYYFPRLNIYISFLLTFCVTIWLPELRICQMYEFDLKHSHLYVRWNCTVISFIVFIYHRLWRPPYLRDQNTLITLSVPSRIMRMTDVPYFVSRRSAFRTRLDLYVSRLDMRTVVPNPASRNFCDSHLYGGPTVREYTHCSTLNKKIRARKRINTLCIGVLHRCFLTNNYVWSVSVLRT